MKMKPEEYKYKVLFSPLGRSDPVCGNYDGSFIHILRYKKPQRAYLYMTKEIFDYAEHDKKFMEMTDTEFLHIEFVRTAR